MCAAALQPQPLRNPWPSGLDATDWRAMPKKTISPAAAVGQAVPETNDTAGPYDPAHPAKRAADGTKPSSKAKKAARAKGSRKKAVAKPPSKRSAKASVKKSRRPARKTFLVAATRTDVDGATALQVYTAVTRSPAEALAAVRAELGPDVAVELTGKLSNRMAKSLGLKPDEVRAI